MNKQFNVLHVVSGKYEPGNGIFTVVHSLLNNISKYGNIDCSLFLSTRLSKTFQHTYKIYQREHISFRTLLLNDNYDLVVFHGIFFADYLKYYRLCIKRNIPYLIKPHSSLMKLSWEKSKLKKQIFYYFGLKKFIEKAKGVVFINKEEQKNSFKFNRTSFIEANGIDYKVAKVNKRHSDKIRFLFFSRIDFHHKGLDYLLNALHLIKNSHFQNKIELNIYGTGNKKEVRRLRSFLKSKNISFAKYCGPIYQDDEKETMFMNSDIMILTSRYEGFPTVITEGLFHGIPPIISPGTNATFLAKNNIGWQCSLETVSIYDAIIRAMRDFEHNKLQISKACIEYAQANLNLSKAIRDTVNMYDRFKQ